FNGQAPGGQQGFSGQAYGTQQNFNGQAPGSQQGFSGQAYGAQQNFNGQQSANQPGMGGVRQNSGDLGGFDYQQNFDGQFDFSGESGFGAQNQSFFPTSNQTPRVPPENFSAQQTGPAPRQRMRNPQQNQSPYSQDQVPFPNSDHLGQ
ncbi:MAG TPA: hypothetical protein VKR83_07410, partial [Ktedonobacteraceae bacterium]|nr:hypothetical protein [Ktedonobacteraceae bacterium]